MKLILIALSLMMNFQLAFASETKTVSIEFAPVSIAPSADSREMRDAQSGETLNVLKTPVLTGADLVSAKVISSSAKDPQVSVALKREAQSKLRDFSAHHQGERLAIVVDSKMMSAPVIRDTMKKDFVVGPMSRAVAEKLVDAINDAHDGDAQR